MLLYTEPLPSNGCCIAAFSRLLCRNGSTCHIAPIILLSRGFWHLWSALLSFLMSLFLQCLLFNCSHCSLLKAAYSEKFLDEVQVVLGVQPSALISVLLDHIYHIIYLGDYLIRALTWGLSFNNLTIMRVGRYSHTQLPLWWPVQLASQS
jgi:hypothetical protein